MPSRASSRGEVVAFLRFTDLPVADDSHDIPAGLRSATERF